MKKQSILSLCGIVFALCLSLMARGQTSITINGPDTVCFNSVGTYSVNSPTSNVTYTWSTTLGAVQGTPVGVSANILWGNSGGTATITVNGYDQSNTLVENGTLNVELVSIPTPNIKTNYRVACISRYTGNDTNSFGEPIPDTLFLDDKYSCPKVCENALVEYEVFGSGGQYKWTVVGGAIQGSSTGTTVNVLWGAAGSGSIKVEEYYGACTVLRVICIDIIEKPTAIFAVLPSIDPVEDCDTFDLCHDSKAAFKDLSIGSTNSQILSWYWDFGDNTSSSQQNPPPHAFPGVGVYKVKLTVTNECGCVDTFCAHINVYTDPGPDILCQAVACENDSVQYCTSADPTTCNSFDWQVVGGTIVTNDNTCITVVWDQLAEEDNFGYVSLAVDCQNLCPAYTTIKVPVVKSNPIITGHDKLCVGNEYKFSIPLWPGTEYNWGVLNNSSAVVSGRQSNEVVLKFTSSGTYDVHVTWKNHISICGGDTTFQVTVMDNDVITGPNVACKGQAPLYGMASTSSANWKLTDPTGSVSTGSGTTYNPTLSMAGIYKLEATNYCAMPLLINVTEITAEIDTVEGDTIVCLNTPYTYKAYSSVPGMVIEWAVVGGTIVGSNIGGSVTVVWTSSMGGQVGAYQKSITYPYCEGPVYVLDITADPVNPNVTGPDTVCSDSYNNYSSNYYSPGATYTWRVEPHTAGNIQSGTYDPDVVFKANRVTTTTNVQIIVQVKKCGLTVEDTLDIVIMPELIPHIYTTQDTFCNGDVIEFTTDPGADYSWYFGDGVGKTTDTPYVKYQYWFDIRDTLFWPDPTAIKPVLVEVVASGYDPDFPMQCPPSGHSSRMIYIRPGPTVIDTAVDQVWYPCGDTISTRLYAWDTLSGGSPSYQWYYYGLWNSPTHTAISGATNPLYTATAAGFYYCIVTGANGCKGLGNTIQIVQQKCPDTACLGNISVAAISEHCANVLVGGTPESSTKQDPQISSHTALGNPITSDTGTLTFVEPGNHMIGYLMQVEQSPGIWCPVVTHTYVHIPLVQSEWREIKCGTGKYDVTLIDNSNYITGTLETWWELAKNLNFTGTLGVDYFTTGGFSAANANYPLPAGVTAGQWYVRQRSRLTGAVIAPQGTPAYCESIFSFTIPEWPTVDINYEPGSICEGLPVLFSADITPTPNPGSAITSYLWDFGDGTFSAVNPTYRVYTYQSPSVPNTRLPQLTVTDEHGCVHQSTTGSIDIWENDVQGNVSGGTTVCNGPVTLTYNNTGTGTPTQYMWSDLGVFTGSSTHNVNTSGSYYVTVEDAHSCRWVTDPEDVTIVNPVNTGIIGRTDYCLGEEVFLSAYAGTGSNLTYSWERNSSSVGGNNPYIFDPGLAAGNYSYDLDIVYADGTITCSTALGPVSVDVHAPPSPPAITALNVLDCQKYELELVGSAPGAGSLVWANGPASANYTIYSGGPYRLFFYDNNGCVSFADTLVPPAPESMFGWFPDGCYELCEDQFPFWLYGPPGVWDFWEWKAVGGAASTINGTNSTVPPYQVTAADDYTLELDNGLCSQVSEVMSVSSNACGPCPDIYVDIQFFCDQDNPGGYTLVLDLNNPSPADMDVHVAFGSGPIKPFKLHLPNGSHQYNLYGVTMQGPPDTLEISYTIRGRKCFFRKPIDPSQYTYPCTNWPSQKPGKGLAGNSNPSEEDGRLNTGMMVFPNPANRSVTINYNYGEQNDSRRRIMVYDMMGRRVADVPVNSYNSGHKLNVADWAQGVYIVRMEEDGRAVHTVRVTITH